MPLDRLLTSARIARVVETDMFINQVLEMNCVKHVAQTQQVDCMQKPRRDPKSEISD